MSNANFWSIEQVRALVFKYFWAQTSLSIRYLSIFEHEHHRALDIRTSSGTNISDSNQITQYGCNYVDFMEINILHSINVRQVFPSISKIRTSSEHERTKNGIFELRASTNTHFSERERASIERFDARHNTNENFK